MIVNKMNLSLIRKLMGEYMQNNLFYIKRFYLDVYTEIGYRGENSCNFYGLAK
jgi:hypothetical protein